MNKQVLIGLSTLSLVTILSGVALSSSNSSAASASAATASVKIPTACTFSGGGTYTATIPNGTSAEIAGSTFSVTCNDAGGFAIYAIGNSGDEYGNNNMIGPSTNIATGTSGNNSYWAMKITPTSGNTPNIENSFDSFHTVPNTQTKVASYSGSTGSGSLSVDATYKANISSTQLAGNYLGKVKYTLIHPATGPAPVSPLAASDCPARSICYAPNVDDIEGTMLGQGFSAIDASPIAGKKTYSASTKTIELRAYNYSRPGYGFAGWSPEYDAKVNTSDIIYGPNASISVDTSNPESIDISTNGLILYPVWVASTGSMQTFTSANCSSMNIGDVTARMDIRDGNVYAIAKLVDGKCWMAENLRLNNDANITPSNTQSNNGAFGGVFTGLANQENDIDSVDTPNSLYSTDGTTANVISGGNSNNWRYRIPRYNNNNTNRTLVANDSGYGATYYQWYGYGNYYTWPAAIADTTEYNTNNQSIENTSLCPTGWRLPRGGNKTNEINNDFWALIVTGLNNGVKPTNYDNSTIPYYDGTSEGGPVSRALRSYPNNFVYSGNFYNSSPSGRAADSRYQTSTSSSYNSSYILRMASTIVWPGSVSQNKAEADAIRCIVNP